MWIFQGRSERVFTYRPAPPVVKRETPLGGGYFKLPTDDYNNPLYLFLLNYFSEEAIVKAFDLYHIRFYEGRVWFPQIDRNGIVWTAKGIVYKEDGHRDKDKPPTWLHCWEGFKGVPNKVLFGSHLLDEGKEAFVVESEKTAVIASIFLDCVFLATGGKNLLKAEYLKGLKNVFVVPDNDAQEDWGQRARENKWGLISVQKLMRLFGIQGEFDTGLDLADCIIEYLSLLRGQYETTRQI